jgi:hypothetical protein
MHKYPAHRSGALLAILLLAGCGGSSNPGTTEVYPAQTGYFLDSAVGNVEYATATQQDRTSSDGAFRYISGEQVTFRLGALALPAVQGGPAITPIDIFGTATNKARNEVNRPAFNLATLLISLDEDSDPANGLLLGAGAQAALEANDLSALDFNALADDFAASIAAVVAASGTASGLVASTTAVTDHLASALGATPADADGDGLYDFEDSQPDAPGDGGGQVPACVLDGAGRAALGQGQATIRFDLAAWSSFGLTPNNFIGAEGNGLTVGPTAEATDLLDVPAEDGLVLDAPQVYVLNGPGTVYGDTSRRTANPTSFSYLAPDADTLVATATGEISLAGVSRWTVDPELGGGQLLFGDYNLIYNSATATWELVNHIDFPLTTFTLGNAQVTTGPGNAFTVTGDLIGSVALNILLSGALGVDLGDFEFQGSCTTSQGN